MNTKERGGKQLNGAYASWRPKRVQDEHDGGCSASTSKNQDTGITFSSPLAPARAQSVASSLMARTRSVLDGRRPSKTAALRCFQAAQATSVMRELSPFHKLAGQALVAADHHGKKLAVSLNRLVI